MGSPKEYILIESTKEDLDKIKKGMWHVYNHGGITEVINKYADAIAYQWALNRVNFDIYKELATKLKEANDRKGKTG